MDGEPASVKESYYLRHYSSVQRSGVQSFGNGIIDRLLLKSIQKTEAKKFLELGAGSGEFTQKVAKKMAFDEYFAVDLSPGMADPALMEKLTTLKGLKFIAADAHELPFPDDSVDLSFSTCLLAHVAQPEKVLGELLRVTKSEGGTIIMALPTDPGLLNQLVKRLVTYPKMRRHGISEPEYVYALEHLHPVHNLIAIARKVFGEKCRLNYFPGIFSGWNLNLVLLLRVDI
jgi:ubiquinone/menaquinone biosynthesis C-methylase UbiE